MNGPTIYTCGLTRIWFMPLPHPEGHNGKVPELTGTIWVRVGDGEWRLAHSQSYYEVHRAAAKMGRLYYESLAVPKVLIPPGTPTHVFTDIPDDDLLTSREGHPYT